MIHKKTNKKNQWVALILSFVFSLGQVSVGFSQTPAPGGDSAASRITGSSFGSRATGVLPGASGSADKVFAEPSYSGLMYQVHILGEVGKPGTYRVTASTRLYEALQLAGGVSGRGSMRSVQIRRKDEGTKAVDILSFTMLGDLNANPYVLDNDVIFVPLMKKVVQIQGTIKRPSTYEIKNEKTLFDLVKLAGGLTPGSESVSTIKLVRYVNGQKTIIDIPNEEEEWKTVKLENADVFVFPHFLTKNKKFDYNLAGLPGDGGLFYPSYEERVFVLGAVAKPGPYPFSPYYDLRHYLTMAGGSTKLAKVKKMKLVRVDGKTLKANNGTEINPGDTIVVPEKYLPPEGLLSLVLGITTSVLGITTTILTLAK